MKSRFSGSQISGFRLRRHHLVSQDQPDLVTVCRSVSGIQAQVMSAAEMALWARNHSLSRSEIQAALWEDRILVRTSCMRQTLHLIPADEFNVYITALKKSRVEAVFRIMSKFGVTLKEADQLDRVIVEELSSGPLTRGELTQRIRPRVGPNVRAWMDRVWSVVRSTIARGLICYGQDRGHEVTFVRVDQWLPAQRAIPEDEAKRILFKRFLSAYAPANLKDFCKWSGIPIKEAAPVQDSLEEQLIEISADGAKGYILRQDHQALTECAPVKQVVRLLPGFDPYLLAHADKSHLVDIGHYKRVYRNQGWISSVVLLDGRVIGIWSLGGRAKMLLMTVEPLERISRAIRAKLEEEVVSLGDFLNTRVEVRFQE